LELSGTWASYLEGRSSNFRGDLKRKQQRAEQAGMEVRMITEPSGVPETLRAFYEIETRSWKEVTGTSITAQPHARRFYDVFLPTAARRGWFLGFVLYLGGRPVAFDMGVLYAQKYYMLKTSYDQEWRDVSPGFVLRACVIEELFRRGVREHDFLGDPEPWKLRWTDAVRRHWNLYLYNTRRPVANLMATGQLLRRRAL
jgi:CelD/BcsL family acetyltransferase involved in cellulose biosynthesis